MMFVFRDENKVRWGHFEEQDLTSITMTIFFARHVHRGFQSLTKKVILTHVITRNSNLLHIAFFFK